MINPLHKLIDEWKEFMKEEFILFPISSLSGANYYMLVPRDREKSKIQIENVELSAVGFHITVFEKVRKEVQNATFHITINLIDQNKKGYVARIYYSELGRYLFTTVKGKENNLVDLGDLKSLLEFGKNNIAPFVTKILQLKQDYLAQYTILENKLHQLSIEPDKDDAHLLRKKFLAYKQELERMINHIQSGTLFNQEHTFKLKHYNDLLMDTEIKLCQLDTEVKTIDPRPVQNVSEKSQVGTTSSTVEKVKTTRSELPPGTLETHKKSVIKKETEPTLNSVKINEINKQIAVVLRSRSLSFVEKIIQEHELQKNKLSLLENTPTKKDKKSTKEREETEYLNTVFRSAQLVEEIKKIVLKVLQEETVYKKIDQQSLKALLQNCYLKTEDLVELAVNNNNAHVLELVMQLRKDVNLEKKTKEEKQYLLEIAYNKGYFDIFKCLLAHKASPNIVDSNKQPILFTACMDARPKEMEVLLEAKANPLALDCRGFAALGALVMRRSRQFNEISMARVLLTYFPQAIEQLQGQEGTKSTPLAYACQEDAWDVVDFLLQSGADPNKTRQDGFTPFGVCVYKDNLKLFKHLVENSTVPIREGLSNALDIAVISGYEQFIDYIMQYSEEHQLDLSVPSKIDAQKQVDKRINSSYSLIPIGTNLRNLFFQSFFEDIEEDMPLIIKASTQ